MSIAGLDIAVLEEIGAHFEKLGYQLNVFATPAWPEARQSKRTVYMHVMDESMGRCVAITVALPYAVVLPIRISDEIKDRKPLIIDLNDQQALASIENKVFEWLQ